MGMGMAPLFLDAPPAPQFSAADGRVAASGDVTYNRVRM
jgi:hypothetical protein